MGNEAMQTADDLADALEEVSQLVRDGREKGPIFDLNGNTVGHYGIEKES
jgi:hypothetical protein